MEEERGDMHSYQTNAMRRDVRDGETLLGPTLQGQRYRGSSSEEGLPAFFESMSFMGDMTIESPDTHTPRRSRHPFSFDDNEDHLSPVDEENEQNDEDIFRERLVDIDQASYCCFITLDLVNRFHRLQWGDLVQCHLINV